MKTIILFALSAASVFGQATTTQTTFSTAVTAATSATVVTLASCTGTAVASTSGGASYLWADSEEMRILSVVSGTIGASGACTLNVRRGMDGTRVSAHSTTTTVYVLNITAGSGSTANPFTTGALTKKDPQGTCTASAQYTLPIVASESGRVWTCPSSGPLSGYWSVVFDPTAVTQITDAVQWVPATACNSSVSGNSTGTNGLTVVGASNVPVIQAQTSSTGTNTHYYTCTIPIPSRTRSSVGGGVALSSIDFVYGVQTTALGTQVATLASGTMNSTTVFGKITLPTAAASETATTVAPARADSGTMVITPVVASFNTATTTAGAFYTARFAPASPYLLTTDMTVYTFTVALLNTATSATITNSPGFYVHYINVPL